MNWIGLRYILVLGALIVVKAYANLPQEQVMVSGQTLSLLNEEGQCAISLDAEAPLVLAIKWPCAFSPNKKGEPRIEMFENIPIVIAQHSTPKPAPSRDCDSERQAVRLTEGRLETSRVMRVASCLNGPIDQKNFTLPSTSYSYRPPATRTHSKKSTADRGLVQATFVGQHVSLVNDYGHCAFVRPGEPPLRLDMAWPCRFSETKQKTVRIELFRGAEILMAERSEPLPAHSTECDTARQVIRHFKNKLEIAPVMHSTRCGLDVWDQKVFVWQFDW